MWEDMRMSIKTLSAKRRVTLVSGEIEGKGVVVLSKGKRLTLRGNNAPKLRAFAANVAKPLSGEDAMEAAIAAGIFSKRDKNSKVAA